MFPNNVLHYDLTSVLLDTSKGHELRGNEMTAKLLGQTYRVDIDGDLVTLTSPTGTEFVLGPTYRNDNEYFAISASRNSRAKFNGTITWDGETMQAVPFNA